MAIAATAPPLSPDVGVDDIFIAFSVAVEPVGEEVGTTDTEGTGTEDVDVGKDEVLEETIELESDFVVELFAEEEVEEEVEVEIAEIVEMKVSVIGAVIGAVNTIGAVKGRSSLAVALG
jgi:hypothetical protein